MACASEDIFSLSKEELLQQLFDQMAGRLQDKERIICLYEGANAPQNSRPGEVVTLDSNFNHDLRGEITMMRNAIAMLDEKFKKLGTPSTQMSVKLNAEKGTGSKIEEEKNSQISRVHGCKSCGTEFGDEKKLAEHEKSHDK